MVRRIFRKPILVSTPVTCVTAKTNNIGLPREGAVTGSYSNSDVVVQPNAFQRLVAFMDAHPEAAQQGQN